MSSAEYRLPRTVVPSHYDIKIEPDLDGASFKGTVGIDVDIAEPTSTVTLNAIELELDRVDIRVNGERRSAEVELDEESERATLTVDEELSVGPARIVIRFKGILNNLGNSLSWLIISYSLPGEFVLIELYRENILKLLTYLISLWSPKQNNVFTFQVVFTHISIRFDYLIV